jgi:hypothetical protein
MSEQRTVPGNAFPPARSFELTTPVLLKPKGADDAAGWPRHNPSCCSGAAVQRTVGLKQANSRKTRCVPLPWRNPAVELCDTLALGTC